MSAPAAPMFTERAPFTHTSSTRSIMSAESTVSSASFRTASSSSSYAPYTASSVGTSRSSSTSKMPQQAPSRPAANSSNRPQLSPVSPTSPLSTTLLERLAKLGVKSQPSEKDKSEAHRLMAEAQMRSAAANGKRYSTSSNLRPKDSTAALEQISLGRVPTVTPGIVLALVEMYEADVCFSRRKSTNFLKAFQDKDQEDVRGQVLEKAATNCSDEIFHILAQHADAQALQEAFPHAIAAGHALKVMILLARGANASTLCDAFLKAVTSGPDELVEALLKDGGRGACKSCRDKGLVIAASLGHGTKGYMLLNKGADPTFDNGRALFDATRHGGVQSLAIQIASAGANSRNKLSPQLLDAVVGEAYQRKQYQLVDVCVKVGASGNATNKVLIEAVRAQHSSLVDTLAHYGASICYDNALSLQLAVQSGNPKILMSLLHGGRSQLVPGVIGAALMDAATTLRDARVILEMMQMLLDANVHGDNVTEVLVRVLNVNGAPPTNDQSFASIAHLLCHKGKADVNAYGGLCFQNSVANGWIETLRVLSSFQPNLQSLENTLEPALTLSDPQLRLRFLETILPADPSGGSLLLSTFKAAARHLLLDVLEFLVPNLQGIPNTVLLDTWKGATAAGRELEWTQPRGLRIIHFLLDRGACGQSVDDAFCRAVSTCRREAIELLQCCVQVPSTYSRALCGLVEASSTWATDPKKLWLTSQLLSWGCDGNSVNTALISAAKAHVASGGSGSGETVIEILLTESGGKVDANFQQGKALRVAASAGNISLLKMLLAAAGNLQRATMTQVFTSVITSPGLDESVILSILDMLSEHRDGKKQKVGFDVNIIFGYGLPPIAACIQANPGHAKLVKRLIDMGCITDTQLTPSIGDKNVKEVTVGEERTNILSWACRLPNISTAVIDVLIEAKGKQRLDQHFYIPLTNARLADVNFTGAVSKATPLLMAARYSRGEIVGKLLAAGAKATAKDCEDMSPLNWASGRGDVDAVKSLLKAKSFTNDGSLHEAARNQHAKVVATLLKAGADVDFPSSKKGHNGRTALQELCLKANSSGNPDALHETIQALHNYKCDGLQEFRGKNALFLALENAEDAYTVTGALLDIAMWKHINDEKNVFSTEATAAGTRTYYSATVYLGSSLYKDRGDQRKIHALRNLLYTKGCVDRWYEVFGPGEPDAVQRDNAVGMPAKIEDIDKRRRDKMEKRRADTLDHNAKLRRQMEEAEQTRLIKERAFQQQTGQSIATHQSRLQQEEQKSSQKMDINSRMHAQQVYQSDAVHRTKVAQQSDMSNQQIQAIQRKQVVTSSMQKDAEMNKANMAYIGAKAKEFEYQQKLDFQRREQQQKLEFQQNQNANTVAVQQRKNRLAIEAQKARGR